MARIGGSRGRLVGDAIVLLLALNSCWNPKSGKPARDETNAGNHGWLNGSCLMVVVVVVDGGGNWRVYPSANRRRVAGLKGSPLRIHLALAKQWLKRRRSWCRCRRGVEHESSTATALGAGVPSHHSLKPPHLRCLVLGPSGGGGVEA